MRVGKRDISFTLGGEHIAASCRLSALRGYITNAFLQFITFQSFHSNIKSKDFICDPCGSYLSFEEEVYLKGK